MRKILILVTSILLFSPCSGADTQSKNEELFQAVQFQDTLAVLRLIIGKADVNYVENGRPILAWAAQNGNPLIVQSLLKAGAKPDATDEMGQTALMRAIDMQLPEVVRVLLKAKADPNAKNSQGEPCLIMGIKSNKPEIVQALINAGADVNGLTPDGDSAPLIAAQSGTPEGIEMIRILGKAKANMNISNIVYTPLSYAIDQDNKEMVQALIDAGADVNTKTQLGTLPIQKATDKKEILAMLLKAKADPNQTLDSGYTPLLQAIDEDNPDSVKLLLEAGANPEASDYAGRNAMQMAEQFSRTAIVEILKARNHEIPKDGTPFALSPIPIEDNGSGCTIVDAAKMQMQLHGPLQEQVNAGKMSSDIFRTFNEDTKEYGDMLSRNRPDEACKLFEKLKVKYGV